MMRQWILYRLPESDYYDPPIIMTFLIIMIPTIFMTATIWFRVIIDITIVLSCILFTILIVKTELEH